MNLVYFYVCSNVTVLKSKKQTNKKSVLFHVHVWGLVLCPFKNCQVTAWLAIKGVSYKSKIEDQSLP